MPVHQITNYHPSTNESPTLLLSYGDRTSSTYYPFHYTTSTRPETLHSRQYDDPIVADLKKYMHYCALRWLRISHICARYDIMMLCETVSWTLLILGVPSLDDHKSSQLSALGINCVGGLEWLYAGPYSCLTLPAAGAHFHL